MNISVTDWMGTPIVVGQIVAYCGADAKGWPHATVTAVKNGMVTIKFQTGETREVLPRQLVVMEQAKPAPDVAVDDDETSTDLIAQ